MPYAVATTASWTTITCRSFTAETALTSHTTRSEAPGAFRASAVESIIPATTTAYGAME